MKSVGITACSDAQEPEQREENAALAAYLRESGNNVILSRCIYKKGGIFSGTGKQRAEELMKMFACPEITDIYDISGGDMANEILDWLDFETIRNSRAVFWGYSDLTAVINAIYSQTGKPGVLYQIKNLIYDDCMDIQRRRFTDRRELFSPSFSFVQGDHMKGTVVGGNLRCFLKLAGTKYFPDVTGRILLMESLGGRVPQMITYLSQLRSCGVFNKINGVLLGTFSEMEACGCEPDIISLVCRFAGPGMPVAKTGEIGHGHDSKAVMIGSEIELHA